MADSGGMSSLDGHLLFTGNMARYLFKHFFDNKETFKSIAQNETLKIRFRDLDLDLIS